MVKKGYFSEIESGILVSVQNKDESKAERIRKEIIQNIYAQFEQNNVSAPIINQAVDSSHEDEADKFAKENKISYGKALFILNLVKKDDSLDAKALAKLNIYEIAKLVKEKNIDIRDIVKFEYDDRFDDKDDKNDDYVAPEQAEKLISKAEAKKKALIHAGVKESDIREYEIGLDREHNVIVYEIEFKSGRYEYSYEVNAENGKVVKYEKEFDD